jgi:5-methylthioadenosine/S-adenosylhomocysteine deaminase
MKITLTPSVAVTCNKNFDVLENPVIHIENSIISYIGESRSAPAFTPDETFGGEHIVAMPGLINTHTHAAMTLVRGYADDMALEPWLNEKIWPYEANLEKQHIYYGTLLAILEMVRGGTTTFADMYFFQDEGARAMLESGIRACPGAVLLGFIPGAMGRIKNGLEWAKNWNGAGDGRIKPTIAPHSLYTCDLEHWEAMIAGARDQNLLMHTHASETKKEIADVHAKWGQTPIQTLEKIGALEGPLLAAHCVYTDEKDREIMQTRGVRVAHNPQSNLKLASGFAPITDYLKRGIMVGLGPDGTASNNNLDMWEEMRLAATLHKATTLDPTAVSARQAIEMATINGAKCLGLDGITGSLEVGKRADITLLDFDAPHLYPRHSVVSHLAYAVNAADVCATMVDGKFLYRQGEYLTLDRAEICATSEKFARELVVKARSI